MESNNHSSLLSSGQEYWQSESPFPDSPFIAKEEEESIHNGNLTNESLESPFISLYETGGIEGYTDPRTVEFLELMAEFNDEEFNEALAEVIGEANQLMEETPSNYLSSYKIDQIISPLETSIDNYIDKLSEAFEKNDFRSLSETELDEYLDKLDVSGDNLSPAFEYFLGKVKKKIKGFAKKASKVISKISPIHLILKKLKKIVKPFIQKFLRNHINKLPAGLRPVAAGLMKKIPGLDHEYEVQYKYEDPSVAELYLLQNELDTQLVNMLFAREEAEMEMQLEDFIIAGEQDDVAPGIRELDIARSNFADKITKLEDNKSPEPLLEEFIPAILMALKVGIKLIGRERVVSFLANLIAGLIGRFVGKSNALMLSKAIASAGMKVMGFEVEEEVNFEQVAGNAVATTVEEVVRQAAALPESIIEDNTLLESYVYEFFENAVAANFPDNITLSGGTVVIKPELTEEESEGGLWVLKPKTQYKKYSKIFKNINLTPRILKEIRTFGGSTLSDFVKDKHGVPSGKNISANIHLFEAIPGTWLSHISRHEKVKGLGSVKRNSWNMLHPLTPEASSILLGKPGLGKHTEAQFLSSRHLIKPGQRFYYLEILDNVVYKGAKSNQVNLVLNFPQNKLKVSIFLSEANAQDIATKIKKNYPASSIVKLIRSVYEAGIRTIFSGKITNHIHIIHEAIPIEQGLAPVAGAVLSVIGKAALEKLAEKLVEWIGRYISECIQQRAQEFVIAAENPADGVSIVISINNPTGFSVLKDTLANKATPVSFLKSLIGGLPSADILIKPGLITK